MDVYSLVAKLSLDSSEYDTGLNSAKERANSIGGAIGHGLKSLAGIGVKAIAGATTAMGGFATASVVAGQTFDKSMSQVAATMGKTVDEMANEVGTVDLAWGTFSGNLREYAQEMGKNTAFSATQAADALNYMALAGYDAQTSMSMLPNVLNLAAAGNMELARASDMVTDTQTAFGISLERTSQMVDEMAKAASTGNTSVEQLGDAFLTVGGLAKEMSGGMVTLKDGTTQSVDGVQELEIALTAMANAGIKGGEAGTHMRNMLLKLASPTEAGTKQLEALGVTVFDAEGKMRSMASIMGDLSGALGDLTQEQKLQAISDLFNTRDTAAVESLLSAVNQDWNAIGESILNADGAAQKMAETQLDNLAGDITLFKSALEGAQIAISDVLSPSLREFVQFGTDGLSKITNAFQEGGLSGAMETFGTILSDALNMIVSKLPMFVDAGMRLLGALGQGIIDNIPIIVDSAVKIAIQFANGLVQALPELGKGAKRLISGLFNSIMIHSKEILSAGMQIVEMLAEGIAEGIPYILTYVSAQFSMLTSYISENAEEFMNTGAQLIQMLADGIAEHIPYLISNFATIIVSLATALTDPNTLTPMIQGALGIIMAIADGLLMALPKLINAVPLIIQNLVSALIANLPQIIDVGIQLIGTLTEAILTNLPLILSAAVQIIFALVQGLIEALPSLLTAGMNLIFELASTIISALPEIWNSGIEIVKSIIGGFLSTLGSVAKAALDLITQIIKSLASGASKLIEAGKTLVQKVKDGFKQKVEDAKQWGKDLIQNFIDGIKAKWEALKETVKNVAQSIKDFLGFSEPKYGPLSNFHTYAPDMMDLFMKGVEDNEGKLTATVAHAFDFNDLMTFPDVTDSNYAGVTSAEGASAENSNAPSNGNNYYTININQKVSTPSEMADAIRLESQYGLIVGEEIKPEVLVR